MRPHDPLKNLSENFKAEEQKLHSKGVKTWFELKKLRDKDISDLVKSGGVTTRNLIRLRGIATLVCDLNLSQSEAALLIHSGVSSIEALKVLTPQELIHKTGRLERKLNTHRKPVLDLERANDWIQRAKTGNS